MKVRFCKDGSVLITNPGTPLLLAPPETIKSLFKDCDARPLKVYLGRRGIVCPQCIDQVVLNVLELRALSPKWEQGSFDFSIGPRVEISFAR